MKREDKIKAMKAEYSNLHEDLRSLRTRIKNEWTTASVQTMREIEDQVLEAEARIAAIKKTEAYKGWGEIA